jgi:hypothetical protein
MTFIKLSNSNNKYYINLINFGTGLGMIAGNVTVM